MILSIARTACAFAALGCLLALQGCKVEESSVGEPPPAEAAHQEKRAQEEQVRPSQIWAPDEGERLWVFQESKDQLGPGGEFHIYVDPETHPQALASFAKFALGVGGMLPEHRHDKTEEIAYFISGEGLARIYIDGEAQEVPIGSGYVWYIPPGAWHAITNTGNEPLTLVFATIPNEKKGLLSFFRRISAKPGAEPVTLSPEDFGKIAAEHDLILKPPPEGQTQ